MSDPAPTPVPRPRRAAGSTWLLLTLGALMALAAYAAWRWNQSQAEYASAIASDRQRLDALEQRFDALRRDQRAQTARLQQAEATNRLLREELIGLGQRAALVEDSVQKLAATGLDAAQAPRLDEIELLLAQGQQRLLLSSDLGGARRAYALAAQLLDGIADQGRLDLRQALAQERAALDALGDDPASVAAGRLEAFAATLPGLPQAPPPAADQPWWDRVLSRLVQVRPSGDAVAATPADQAAGLAALQLELGLARAAIVRRDEEAYRAALGRVDGWLARLWPASVQRERQHARLRELQAQPLALQLPTLGSTLAELRRQRGG